MALAFPFPPFAVFPEEEAEVTVVVGGDKSKNVSRNVVSPNTRRQRRGRSSMLARSRASAAASGCQRPPPTKQAEGSRWM